MVDLMRFLAAYITVSMTAVIGMGLYSGPQPATGLAYLFAIILMVVGFGGVEAGVLD